MDETSPTPRVSAPPAFRLAGGAVRLRTGLAEVPGLPLSFVLHVVVAVVMVVSMRAALLPRPVDEKGLTVDILTTEQFAELAPPAETDAPPSAVPPPAPAPDPSETIRATHMLSAGVLADPRSRQAKATLPQLEPAERMIQLCGLEAMEQVHLWQPAFRPDSLVAYALSDPAIAANGVHAEGAAFRSEGNWYRMSFDCAVTPDHMRVLSFTFRVGDPVPPEEWEAHNLTGKS